MLSTEDLSRLYAELERRWPTPALDELDKTLYATEVRHLTPAALMGVIAEIRRGEQFRPLPRRVGEIVDSLSDPADSLPPAQAQAYRQIEAPSPARGIEGSTLTALVESARPDNDTHEAWHRLRTEQPGRFQFLNSVAGLLNRKDVKKRPDYQPAPGAGSRRTLLSSLRAAGLLISAAETLQPDDRAAADAELQRIRETKDVFASLYCLLSTDKWTPYHQLAAETDKEKIARIALDTGLKLMIKRGKVEMKSEGGVSLWRLVESDLSDKSLAAEENEAGAERMAA